jgi:membrane fusion protein (multidrug efflux system)
METPATKPNNQVRKRRLLILLASIGLVSLLAGTYWWFFIRHRVSTDDAYAVADSARLSSRVPGTVLRVLVENDYPVKTGKILVEMDPRDYQVAVDRAQGALARIEAEIQAQAVSIAPTDTQTAAQIQAAATVLQQALDTRRQEQHSLEQLEKKRLAVQADLDKAGRDFKRFGLFRNGAVSAEQHDTAGTVLVKAKADLEAIDAQLAAVKAFLAGIDQQVERARVQLRGTKSDRYRVEVQTQKLAALKAQKQEAEAMLEAAKLNLSYCTITAPISGYIAQKNVQVGDHVQAGQPLMAVVPLREVYVEANFKETELEDVRLGQPATIRADMYPGYSYHGKVVGIRAGTGAAFSLLPPENATGNWIKVVQRVPVRIDLDSPPPADFPLRLGSSLQVTINTTDLSGPVLMPTISKP